ncbi:precorrin-3B C(17)-methyltransferase [Leptolyngbya sp. NIES-2104]|uniref:precorrin-3B C(17)-methyltransferase n=1 Tax=Leptolyngbya sp. NIES-2104 TaxID=1552121 RepID=UPI0006EC7302|nr:precorrin-3B C(17)-methyltransferase [Leptolyngbya sp. NIES-2104]GAP98094.1 cobalamin biosynthesis protein CbiG / Cobalt-precorrin-3b C17-methyltransferase [Leptolyngbya sp. NIES-2104]
MSIAVVVLGQASVPVARRIVDALPNAVLYGLEHRTTGVDRTFTQFGETVRELFSRGTAIVGICAAGILIRTVAPLLNNKWKEPAVIAIAEDGSAVVPLLGGLQGVNDLAREIATVLETVPAITTTGDIRFRTALLLPPNGYQLLNPDDAKTFLADLLAGETVKIEGSAPWLENSQLPIAEDARLTIKVTEQAIEGGSDCLVYQVISTQRLAIIGTGPGSAEWMSPQVREVLRSSTDWIGYQTYLNLVEPLRTTQQIHVFDNREELERAALALNLAAEGRSVVMVSSGDPGIYAMAAAVFEVLERENKPEWSAIDIQVCPGISAMQAAAAQVGAPLGHDFCAISLSDILKPWETIADRICAAAQADFAIAFYNPISKTRTWQLEKAKHLLLNYRTSDTPIVLARNLGRPGQQTQVKRLGDLSIEDADMRTVILIGSSKTRSIPRSDGGVWVYTPRRYDS